MTSARPKGTHVRFRRGESSSSVPRVLVSDVERPQFMRIEQQAVARLIGVELRLCRGQTQPRRVGPQRQTDGASCFGFDTGECQSFAGVGRIGLGCPGTSRVRKPPSGTLCGGGCSKCDPANIELYEWSGSDT